MAERHHSQEMIAIPLPYEKRLPSPHTEVEELLYIEPGAKGMTGSASFQYMVDELNWDDDEVMELIFRAAVVLYHAKPDATFGECLSTSLTWYAG